MADIGSKNIGHISYQMEHTEEMLHFYRDILGMREQFTLYFRDLLPAGVNSEDSLPGDADEGRRAFVRGILEKKDQKWMTYLKLADRQFIEFFYPVSGVNRRIRDRWAGYGYTKMNFETASIEAIREILTANGVPLAEDIHGTVDGAREIKVFDPDGNEVQFTEYPAEGARIPMPEEKERRVFANVSYITQAAYQVKDAAGMLDFYTKGLGLALADRLTCADLAAAMEGTGAPEAVLQGLKAMGDSSWIDYIEVAPHQYIELFHVLGPEEKKTDRDLKDAFGYQHICIEVEDIHRAWDAVLANGLTPDTQIRLGAAGAWQFWLVDPDGNRLELMQYGEGALQLR